MQISMNTNETALEDQTETRINTITDYSTSINTNCYSKEEVQPLHPHTHRWQQQSSPKDKRSKPHQ